MYLNITSHVDSHPDQGMLQKKGGKGFPYVVMMDDQGEVLSTFRPDSREAVQGAAKTANEIVGLRKKVKADPKDVDSKARLLMATLKLKPSDDDRKALTEIMKSGKVKAATKEAYKGFETREKILAFGDEFNQAARSERDDEKREAVIKEFQAKAYKLFKDGLRPAETGTEYLNYLASVANGAIDGKDKATAEMAVKAFEESGKGLQQVKKFADELKEKIAQI